MKTTPPHADYGWPLKIAVVISVVWFVAVVVYKAVKSITGG